MDQLAYGFSIDLICSRDLTSHGPAGGVFCVSELGKLYFCGESRDRERMICRAWGESRDGERMIGRAWGVFKGEAR